MVLTKLRFFLSDLRRIDRDFCHFISSFAVLFRASQEEQADQRATCGTSRGGAFQCLVRRALRPRWTRDVFRNAQ